MISLPASARFYGREPTPRQIARTRRWLEEKGINKYLERVAKQYKARPHVDLRKAKDPVRATIQIIVDKGVRWPIERALEQGKKAYQTEIVREDRKKIRQMLRSAVEQIPGKDAQLKFLYDLQKMAEKEYAVQVNKAYEKRSEINRQHYERITGILLAIVEISKKMRKHYIGKA